MAELASMQRYDSYKDSGVRWLDKIPENWEVERSQWLFTQRKERARKEDKQLTASQKYGMISQEKFMEIEGRRVTQVEFNPEILKHVEANDFVISMRSFQGGIEYCGEVGCVSSAYVPLIPSKNIHAPFFKYLLKSQRYIEALQSTSNLVRDGQALRYDNFRMVDLPIIPIDEQTTIANFLDKKTAQIDEAIAIKEKQTGLLKERKKIVIQQSVTQGLTPDVPMKDSGVDWIGKIPEHWDVRRAKYIFKKQSRAVRKQDDVITCFRDGEVTLRTNRRTEGFTFASKEHGYQGIRKGDLVIHAMDAFAGAIGVSDSDGKSSPVYSVCTPQAHDTVNCKYYALYLRNLAIGGFIESLAKGIRERSTDFRFNDFAELFFPLPDYRTQCEVVSYIEQQHAKIDSGIQHLEKQIVKLKEYKTTLINSVVTGKIKVPGVV